MKTKILLSMVVYVRNLARKNIAFVKNLMLNALICVFVKTVLIRKLLWATAAYRNSTKKEVKEQKINWLLTMRTEFKKTVS